MDIEKLMGTPTTVQVSRTINENKKARTLVFELPRANYSFKPGQFLMCWIPGIDEIPMSISLWNPPEVGVTVLPIGEATSVFSALSTGQRFGVRGPFGSGFSIECERALIIGGGIGMAPLKPLAYQLRENGIDATALMAAKTKNELLYVDELEGLVGDGFDVQVATDDGSAGFKGIATDVAREIFQNARYDTIYTCGPEPMMAKLHMFSKEMGITIQASLERFMKCGCGICGTCALDPTGDLVCVEGPVFTGNRLNAIEEFGKYHRDSTGVKIRF